MLALGPESTWSGRALRIEKERHLASFHILAISAGGSSNMRRFRWDMQIYMHFSSTIGQGPSGVASSSSVPQSPLYVSIFFKKKSSQGNLFSSLNRNEHIVRFRRLLQVLPVIMLFRYGVVLKSCMSTQSVVQLSCCIWPVLWNFGGPIISTWS